MSRRACHKEDHARTLLVACWEDLQNVPESLPQREACQELARKAFKMPRKACHKREPCQDLARRSFKMSRKACHKKNRARTLLGGPSKCPGKLATKRIVPGPC